MLRAWGYSTRQYVRNFRKLREVINVRDIRKVRISSKSIFFFYTMITIYRRQNNYEFIDEKIFLFTSDNSRYVNFVKGIKDNQRKL